MKHLLAAASAVALLISLPRCDAVEEFELTLEQALARARERAPEIVAAQAAVEEANTQRAELERTYGPAKLNLQR